MLDLFFDLRRRQEQMCIILREIADTEQAVKLTGFLMTMHETELTKAQRQITIAVLMRLINQHAARAVHRLDRIIFIVNLREVHVLRIMSPMTGLFPKFAVHDHRGHDFLIAITTMHFTPVIDEFIADDHAIRMEERESRTFLMQAEKIELFAQFTMIAFLGFLQHLKVLVQVSLFLKSRTIDTLKHLIMLITTPVSTSNALQFDGLDLAR